MHREIKFKVIRKSDNKEVCCYQEGLTMVPDTGQLYQGGMNVTDRYLLKQIAGELLECE